MSAVKRQYCAPMSRAHFHGRPAPPLQAPKIIGRDAAAFVSAINSGAAGLYAVYELVGNQHVATDLTIEYEMEVQIFGLEIRGVRPPAWGRGGFAVGSGGSLMVKHVQLDAAVRI